VYKLLIRSKAKDTLRKLPDKHRQALVEGLGDITAGSYLGKPLSRELSERFSYRVGVYRIIYKIDEQNKVVYVSSIGHRRSVYSEGR
jgi:mRNA interferase RelE/StbE